jgi:hypothetical protein
MTVVKKSVVIHPEVDKGVRVAQASMILAGLDTSYSTALNLLALAGMWALSKYGNTPELQGLLLAFLKDTTTLKELKIWENASEIQDTLLNILLQRV